MRRVTHERYISQSQRANCDLARRYVGLNLSQHVGTAALKGVEARTGVLRNIGGVAQNAITTSAARASTVLFA